MQHSQAGALVVRAGFPFRGFLFGILGCGGIERRVTLHRLKVWEIGESARLSESTVVAPVGNYCSKWDNDHHHLQHHRHHHLVVQYVVQKSTMAANTKISRMLAQGIKACDSIKFLMSESFSAMVVG